MHMDTGFPRPEGQLSSSCKVIKLQTLGWLPSSCRNVIVDQTPAHLHGCPKSNEGLMLNTLLFAGKQLLLKLYVLN